MLDDNGYIERTVIFRQGSKEIMSRYIKLKDKGSLKNYTDNTNINITNTNLTDSNSIRFKKPTLDEVKNYCILRQNNIDPEAFIAYYESKGWTVGSGKMKNWKAAVTTWEKKNFNKPTMSKIDTQINEYLKGKEYL